MNNEPASVIDASLERLALPDRNCGRERTTQTLRLFPHDGDPSMFPSRSILRGATNVWVHRES